MLLAVNNTPSYVYAKGHSGSTGAAGAKKMCVRFQSIALKNSVFGADGIIPGP